nr:MAG TPA: hypothetical protein [Caudoviricetes sp.]DAQ23080.1 MAG TPA: hypothetical protein [Bacteriophage sp.]
MGLRSIKRKASISCCSSKTNKRQHHGECYEAFTAFKQERDVFYCVNNL